MNTQNSNKKLSKQINKKQENIHSAFKSTGLQTLENSGLFSIFHAEIRTGSRDHAMETPKGNKTLSDKLCPKYTAICNSTNLEIKIIPAYLTPLYVSSTMFRNPTTVAKLRWSYRGFYLVKKKTPNRFPVILALLWCACHC